MIVLDYETVDFIKRLYKIREPNKWIEFRKILKEYAVIKKKLNRRYRWRIGREYREVINMIKEEEAKIIDNINNEVNKGYIYRDNKITQKVK